MNRNLLCRALAVALAGASAPAFAVTNVENNASIPFSFSNPGARSLGMGGAFLGLADDATAAYTNPAGLVGLGLEKQFSIEVREIDYKDRAVTGGEIGTDPLDTSGLQYGRFSESQSNVSFLSFVWPSDRWSLAVYRHQLVDYSNDFQSDAISVAMPQFQSTGVVFPVIGDSDLEIINYGVSFGWRFNDALSVGAGLSWYDFDMDSVSFRFDPDGTAGDPAFVLNEQRQRGSDDDIGYNLGLLYRGSDNFQVGVAYRSAPEFSYRATSVLGAAAGDDAGLQTLDRNTRFEAPDMFGVGFAWRPSDALTITADINKINYSNLTESMDSGFLPDAELSAVDREVLGRLRIDDVIEPHVGLEYVLLNMQRPLSLRLGAWYEDRHTIRFEGDLNEFEQLSANANEFVLAAANAALFSAGEDQMHWSVGLGWAFSSFQIDFAADFSDHRDTLSLSGVWRF